MFLMDLQVCFGLLWVCFNFLIFSATSQSTPDGKIWVMDSTFNDKIVPVNNLEPNSPCAHSFHTASSRRLCAVTCAQRSWCRSFFYKKSTAECYLQSRVFESVAGVVNDPGVRYYKLVEEKPCPTWKGYKRECFSGLCYKVNHTILAWLPSRDACQAEGGDMITLDTDQKLQGIFNAMVNDADVNDRWYHVGAARPYSEWDTPWTSSSTYFLWLKTGQTMMPAFQAGYFHVGGPEEVVPERSCIDMGIIPYYRYNFTSFLAFSHGVCMYQCGFICEV